MFRWISSVFAWFGIGCPRESALFHLFAVICRDGTSWIPICLASFLFCIYCSHSNTHTHKMFLIYAFSSVQTIQSEEYVRPRQTVSSERKDRNGVNRDSNYLCTLFAHIKHHEKCLMWGHSMMLRLINARIEPVSHLWFVKQQQQQQQRLLWFAHGISEKCLCANVWLFLPLYPCNFSNESTNITLNGNAYFDNKIKVPLKR